MKEREMGNSSYQTYVKRINDICSAYGDKEALAYLRDNDVTEKLSFVEVKRTMKIIEEMVMDAGVREGDRVAVIAPTMANTVLVLLALTYAHITVVVLDSNQPIEEIERLLKNADVRGIFSTEAIFQILDMEQKILFPCFDLGGETTTIRRIPNSAEKVVLEETQDKAYDVISILFSSGTTSSAKGVMITYESILNSRNILSDVFGLKSSGEKYFLSLPLNHISGLDSMMLFFLSGCSIGIAEKLSSSKLQQALLMYQPHYFGMVPKVYEIIAEKIYETVKQRGTFAMNLMQWLLKFCGHIRKRYGIRIGKVVFKPIYGRVFGKNITGLAVMGANCKEETAELFLNMGLYWANLYATTETNAPITSSGVHDRYPGNSVGNVIRHKAVEIRIVNPDRNGIGEIQVKSSMIMRGYFREPELTQKAFEDGWFATGDLGWVDETGYLYLAGRQKDVSVLPNGEKVSLMDLEVFFGTLCPEVSLACCGVPSEDGYDRIYLFLEKGNFSDDVIQKYKYKIEKYITQSKSNYQLSGVVLIDKLPQTALGKVKRYELKNHILNEIDFQHVDGTEAEIGTESLEESVISFVRAICKRKKVEDVGISDRLVEDLGIDSLEMFELYANLESNFHVNIMNRTTEVVTVKDLIHIVSEERNFYEHEDRKVVSSAVADFPKKKRFSDKWLIMIFNIFSKIVWNYHIEYLAQIDPFNSYILCPNHESYFDAMWVSGAISQIGFDMDNFDSLAAEHLMGNIFMNKAFTALGGIPVNRTGNTMSAIERALQCLKQGKCIMLIHPEGTRSRNGKLGEFKLGAAELSKNLV